MKSFFKKLLELDFLRKEDWIITARRRYAQNVLKKKFSAMNYKSLSARQKFHIESLWENYHERAMKLFNMDQYAVYNKYSIDDQILYKYIPDDFYYCYADTYFTNYHTSIKLDNKNLYDLYFYDINRPTSIVRNVNGVLLDSSYKAIDISEAIELCIQFNNIIVKSAINSDGGHGIRFIDNCFEHREVLRDLFLTQKDFIIQSIIKQHPKLSSFNPQSINTIRVMTLYFKDKVHVLSSVFRIGVNGSRVDNASSGGVVCGIHDDGSLKEVAYDSSANIYSMHPQGQSFDGIIIPSYHELINLSISLANRFLNYSKLISWDFAIDEDAKPVLIEANFTGGQLDFHQLTNGPIWGDMTMDILEEIFTNSKELKEIL